MAVLSQGDGLSTSVTSEKEGNSADMVISKGVGFSLAGMDLRRTLKYFMYNNVQWNAKSN